MSSWTPPGEGTARGRTTCKRKATGGVAAATATSTVTGRRRTTMTASASSASGSAASGCVLCGRLEMADPVAGAGSTRRGGGVDELLEAESVRAHYHCLLFSSGLEQNGHDEDDGLHGFLPGDIRAELKRGTRLKCVYCKKKGATVGCSRPQCKRSYHLPCGVANKSLQQHFDEFKSFCFAHRPNQRPMTAAKANKAGTECLICQEDVVPAPHDRLYPPCCTSGWMHRPCVQRMANTFGGYSFACPVCKDTAGFKSEMQRLGVAVPTRDAQWEAGEEAFYDRGALERRLRCCAKICFCQEPSARAADRKDGLWEILPCVGCGSRGIHVKCGGLDEYVDPEWSCYTCRRIVRFTEADRARWERPIAAVWGTARAKKTPGAKVSSPASQKADLFRAISQSVRSAPSATATSTSSSVALAAAATAPPPQPPVTLPPMVLERFSGTVPITTAPQTQQQPAEDPMNYTLEDLIVKNLDRDPSSTTPQKTSSLSVAAAAVAVPLAVNAPASSPETEASPGDSDYESEGNHSGGSPKSRKRSAEAAAAGTGSNSAADVFNQKIKKSIKDLFLVN